jgi:D-sedoheptulose 7-phosphate isomerase
MDATVNWRYAKDFFSKSIDVINALPTLSVARIIDILFVAWKNGNNVFLIGNGGSASTATHFASDLVKTVVDSPDKRGLRATALVDNIPLSSATVNDWGKEHLFTAPLRTFFNPGDIVVAFSVHGGAGRDKDGAWSQNLLQAIQYAKDHGGKTIGFAGFDGGAMKDLCDECVVVPADSTPLVESLHVLLTHLITFRLKELINE